MRPGRDRRFADPAWESNWLLRRLLQGYLSVGATVDGLIADAELDWRSEHQARFVAANVLDALAPSNFPWSNPAVLKAIVDEGGANLVRGARRFAGDFPGLPAAVDTRRFAVGENLALTPGAVIARTEVLELIEYAPQTEHVRETPLLFVPPTINKYYALDLAPGRSLAEYLVQQGQRVYMISWRNPGEAEGHFDFDTYADAILGALSTRSPASAHIAGGVLGRDPERRRARPPGAEDRLGDVASLTLLVTALDNERAGTASALATRELVAAAVAESARRGYVDGRALAQVFTWLRPNDLVWSSVVNNYLLGKEPPAFDVLYWNQDTVRLAAGLHRDFVRIGLENALVRPGALEVLGSPVDLGAVDVPSYVVAAEADHLIPWENAYRSTQLLGGDAALRALDERPHPGARQPARRRAAHSYRVAREHPADPREWHAGAATLPRELVAGLGGLARRALRRARRPRRSAGAGTRRLPAPTSTRAEPIMATTDYFLVRDQFGDDQWEPFLRTRRFVDEEVLPVINDYWEPAELPWPLMHRLAELGLLEPMGPLAPRARAHGAAPRRRQPRHVPRRPVRARDEDDRDARLRRAARALAAGAREPGEDRRLRADRARARLGLGLARDERAPRRPTSG